LFKTGTNKLLGLIFRIPSTKKKRRESEVSVTAFTTFPFRKVETREKLILETSAVCPSTVTSKTTNMKDEKNSEFVFW
jgi:hypothetical protein